MQKTKYEFWFEFGTPFTVDYFRNICVPQLNELLKYKPNHMWFDGDWKITQKNIQKQIKLIVNMMTSNNIIVNDRIGKNNIGLASYRVFSDRYIPVSKLDDDIVWQHVNTIGYSWGYNKMQKSCHYKSKEEIYELHKNISKLGGMFLINIGPNENADIIKEEIDALKLLKSR